MPYAPIATKIAIPPTPAGLLHRERLVDFLHDHIDRKLIVVAAPPGYGKTTLLADFARTSDLPVCWYTLDVHDRDPQVFLEHLVASVARQFPDFGDQTRRVLAAVPPLAGNAREVMGVLVNEMIAAIPEWFVVVLDDFHAIADAEHTLALIDTLLQYQPEHIHLVIASRSVPEQLPLLRMTARGEAIALEREALHFTASEVEGLFSGSRYVRVSHQEAVELARVSEGWITGIVLAAPAFWQGQAALWAQARASGEPVFDYLAGEVLAHQSEHLRAFLLASSTLEEMTCELCIGALGLEGADEWLRQLESRNLFAVCFEGEGNRLRYHALFRAFLQAQLERESPAAFLDLHRRAAMWFERHGDAVRAAEHFMVCGEPEQAARVVDREARTLLRVGHLETLIEWVQRLPEGVTLTTPTLTFCAAEAASDAGWVEQALAWLALSEAACRSGVAGGDLLALVLSARALIDYNRGRYADSQRTAQEALALLLDGGAPSGEASAEAQRVIGMCALRLGDLAGAEQHLRAALEGSEAPHRQVLAQEGLALCLFERGQVKDALRMGRAAVATCRRLGSPGYLAEALNDLACSLYPLGKYDEALEALREGLEAARQAGHRRIEAFALVSLGEVLLDVGDAEAAVDALAEGVKIAAEIDQVLLLAHGQEMLALACFQLKDTYRATLAAQDACDLAERQENRGPIGRCKAVYGLVRVAAGDVERGRGCLAEACEMLERTGSAQEVARAYLFLAHAYHQEGRAQETAGALSRALDLYAAGEFAHRLLVDSRFVLPTLKEAAQGSSSSARVAAVLREASQFRSAAQRTLKQWRDASVEPGFSFRAYGFGRGHVEREGIPIAASAWDAASARHFFFYFLSYPVRAREQVFADIWPDQEPSTGLFHTTKYRVRRALGVTAVLHEDGAYRLNAGLDVWYDVREFEQLIERARRVPRVQALRYLRQAIDLYGGDFLADCYADWCVELREALRQQYLEAIGTLAGHLLALRRPGEAAPILRRGLEVDNLREDLCRQLMRALALDGRADEAAAHYRQCARVLERELGFEPESETTELYRAICAGRFP